MDEKMFELMEKMYADLTGQMAKMNNEMQDGFRAVKQDIVRLENKMDENHKVLHDRYKQTYEKLTALEEKVDEIDKKVERQDVEIRVINAVK